MKTTRNILLLALATTAFACSDSADPQLQAQDEQTETFRQALPAAEDLQMTYSAGAGAANALEGERSSIATLTASAIIGTNGFMVRHFAMVRAISQLPPTEAAENFRAWEGEHDDLTLRIEATATDTPRGTRYDYTLAGRVTADGGELLPILDGHVVRLDEEYQPRDGFGIVRWHFDNLNTLEPEREINGKLRIAFRKANRAHQVHVRAIEVQTPDDPNFPRAAEYVYAVRPDTSGAMRWFSRSNVLGDSDPLENVAVHTVWRADKSGIGSAVVVGGSLEVDYWHLIECWGDDLRKGYDSLDVPELHMESGDAATCFNTPDDLEPPAMEEELADEDPEIPEAMPEENEG